MKPHLQLETDTLLMRPFDSKEYEVFTKFMNDSEATRFLLFSPEQKTPEGMAELFKNVQRSYATIHETLLLVIAEKSSHELIGIIGLCEDFDSEHPQLFWHVFESNSLVDDISKAIKKLLHYLNHDQKTEQLTVYIDPEDEQKIEIARQIELQEKGELHSKVTGKRALLFSRF